MLEQVGISLQKYAQFIMRLTMLFLQRRIYSGEVAEWIVILVFCYYDQNQMKFGAQRVKIPSLLKLMI